MVMEHDVQPDFWPLKKGDTLSNHDWWPFYGHRFLSSEFTGLAVMEGRRAEAFTAVMLWAEAMRQDPAGTLPQSDVQLASLARFATIEDWAAQRDVALHGWFPVLVEDEETGQVETRLGHDVLRRVAEDMARRKRGRDAGREAARLSLKKSRIRKKMQEIGVSDDLIQSDRHVTALANWFEQGDLFVTADNVRAGLVSELGWTGQVRQFPGGR